MLLLHRLPVRVLSRSSVVLLQRYSFSTISRIPDPPTSNHKHTALPNAAGLIIYTETDEAPALATFSLYPVISKVRILVSFLLLLLPYR